LNYYTADIKQHYCRLFSLDSNHSSYYFIKCFLCNDSHFIKDCEFFSNVKQNAQKKTNRLTVIKLYRLTAVKLY